MRAEGDLSKLVYAVWAPDDRAPEALRACLLDRCAPALLEAGAGMLQVNVDDQYARVRSPSPGVHFERPIRAQVNVWLRDPEARAPLEDVLMGEGLQVSGFLVDEQIYTDYGGNRHAAPRSWADGERSPGVLSVTFMERPRRLSRQEWIRRWHEHQSPMSEAMQPRTRYVRNVVERPLSPGAPAFEGIVEEAWPSFRHVTNPFLFYGAKGPFALVKNMTIMLRGVTAFLDLRRIRTVTMSEYFVRTGFGA